MVESRKKYELSTPSSRSICHIAAAVRGSVSTSCRSTRWRCDTVQSAALDEPPQPRHRMDPIPGSERRRHELLVQAPGGSPSGNRCGAGRPGDAATAGHVTPPTDRPPRHGRPRSRAHPIPPGRRPGRRRTTRPGSAWPAVRPGADGAVQPSTVRTVRTEDLDVQLRRPTVRYSASSRSLAGRISLPVAAFGVGSDQVSGLVVEV